MDVITQRPHTFFDKDPASLWCYHRDAHQALLDMPKACDAFTQIAKNKLRGEYEYVTETTFTCDYEDSFYLKHLGSDEFASLCRITSMALDRPGFLRSCLPMEELLFRAVKASLYEYLDDNNSSDLWPIIIKELGCGDDPQWVLNDLFWDYDWELFEQTPEEAEALAEDLKALW